MRLDKDIQAHLEQWLETHKDCGGEQIDYAGRHEFRIGCTCGDRR